MSKLVSLLALALATALPMAQPGVAAESPAPAAQQEQAPVHAYLGVVVENLLPIMRMQMPRNIPRGQGIFVMKVEPDSPADRAGIEPFDILLSYDDQKLFSPGQLSKLVRVDKAGRKVAIELLRHGKADSISVLLGQKTAYRSAPQRAPRHTRGWYRQHRPYWGPFGYRRQAQDFWESFDSLSLQKMEGNRYKARIAYLGKDGEKKQHVFEGTRAEIRNRIFREKDLPDIQKQQLLEALEVKNDLLLPELPPYFDFQPLGHLEGWPPGP